jgi:UrcA family protein
MTFRTTALLAAALMAVAACPALAQPAGEAKAANVHYADLDLTNPAGAMKLYRRIEATADYVCGGRPATAMEREAEAAYATCMRTTVASAIRDTHAPLLIALVEGGPARLASR